MQGMIDQRMCVQRTVVITAGQSLSTMLDKSKYKNITIFLPANWDDAKITFAGSDTDAGPFNQVVNSITAAETTVDTAAESKVVILDGINRDAMAAIPFIKLRSGTLAVAVNQSATVTISIVLTR